MSKRPIELELKYNGREKRLELDDEKIIVGRSSTLKASTSDCLNVSREHLKIEIIRETEIWITDLSSTNGTFYDGRRIEPNVSVKYQGANLCIGPNEEGVQIKIKFIGEAGESAAPTPNQVITPAVAARAAEVTSQIVRPEPTAAKITQALSIQRPAQVSRKEVEFDGDVIEAAVKKKHMGELTEQIHTIEHEIVRLHGFREAEQVKLDEVLKRVSQQEAQERAMTDRVRELQAAELASKNLMVNMQEDIDRKQREASSVQNAIEDFQKRRTELEENYYQDEQKIVGLREKLKTQESELHKKTLEVQSETERLMTEFEYLKKKCQLDSDNLEAELKLKRAQMERESEELRTKKVALERDVDTLQEKHNRLDGAVKSLTEEKAKLEQEITVCQSSLSSLRATISEVDAKKRQLETEVEILGTRVQESTETAKRLTQSAETNAKEMVDVARLEANRIVEEGKSKIEGERMVATNDIQRFRTTTENELREREQKLLGDIAQDKKEAEEAILKSKNEWKIEHEYLKGKATKDYEAATKAWKDELNRTKEKDAEELRLWLADEEKKVRSKLSTDMDHFVYQVSSRTLTEIPKGKNVDVGAIMTSLEMSLKNALTNQAAEHGSFNPHLKQQKKKFWKKTATMAASLVALGFGLAYGPTMISQQLARLKIENKQENEQFMKSVREQRERMLALQLAPRALFQESYVDNILYNPGYLAMKQDEALKNEWTLVLSKFFFEELLFDDRKVVEYVPIETSMILELGDINKVLNKRNFDVNLAQMKSVEQTKTEEMWLLVGGRDNWAKLRAVERDFYQKHAADIEERARMPASMPAKSKF